MLHVRSFVLQSSSFENRDARIVPAWFVELALDRHQVERGHVTARKVLRQVCR